MKSCFLFPLLFAAVSATPALGAADEPLVLAPSSPWNMHYDDDSCVLRRTFGEGENKVQLDMRRFSPTDGIQVTVIAESLQTRKGSMQARIQPSWDWHEMSRPFLPVFEGNHSGVIFNLYDIDDASDTEDKRPRMAATLAKISAGSSLEMEGPFSKHLKLQTGPLRSPLAAMSTCLSDLVRLWGLDPEEQEALQAIPRVKNMKSLVGNFSRFFPSTPLNRNEDGIVNARLMIDAKGEPVSCAIQTDVSDATYEDRTCKLLMSNARFEAARDRNGTPVASYWTIAVNFRVD